MRLYYYFLIFYSILVVYQVNAQNLVSNGDFENYTRNSGWGYVLNNPNALLTGWNDLYRSNGASPNYYNANCNYDYARGSNFPVRTLMPFRNKGYLACLNEGWLDSNRLFVDSFGSADSYYEWGLVQKLPTVLKKDSWYTVSIRCKMGDDRDVYAWHKDFYDINGNIYLTVYDTIHFRNLLSSPDILFSTYPLRPPPSNRDTKLFIDTFPNALSDTSFDNSYQWRLIEHTFKADSSYEYINIARFYRYWERPYYIIPNIIARRYETYPLTFVTQLDDIRLLPRSLYLKVSRDTTICNKGDSVSLKVFSGEGDYKWCLASDPVTIVSNTSSLRYKIDSTIMFQVMSPYDTASIMVYLKDYKYQYDTVNYSTCENKPLRVSTPNIFRWYDNTKDTAKTFTTTGNYWYETKTNCDVKKTQMNIKIDISKYDTIRQTSCDSFTYKNTSYKNSGFYTFPYKSIYGCDSMQTLALTIHKSYYQGSEINSCKPYQWLDSIYTQSGKYHKIMKTLHQCDSIIELDLNIGLDRRVRLENGIHYTALQDSVRYEWYRCNPWRRITNETKQTFTTKTRGSYAVVLDNGKGCRDTSDCLELYSSALINPAQAGVSMWSVFPNPFSDELIIDLGKEYKEVSVKMYDLTGRLISNQVVKNHSTLKINNSKLPSGIYYLQIETESQNQFFNIRKE